jgi:ParB/RepB/Spo0J family partition protein
MAKHKVVAVASIDEPADPIRRNIPMTGIEELSASIREHGLIENLVVKTTAGGRYEVIAGHRRLLALRMAGTEKVDVMVRDDAVSPDAVKLAENLDREEMNPADEAAWIGKLFMENGEDVDAVCRIVKRTREYVERRLILIGGDEHVLFALRDGKLNAGQADELNKIEDPAMRAYYMSCVISSGASIRQLRTWRVEANVRFELQQEEEARRGAAGEAPQPVQPPPPEPQPRFLAGAQPHELSSETGEAECRACKTVHPRFRMFKFHVCEQCADGWQAEMIRLGQR